MAACACTCTAAYQPACDPPWHMIVLNLCCISQFQQFKFYKRSNGHRANPGPSHSTSPSGLPRGRRLCPLALAPMHLLPRNPCAHAPSAPLPRPLNHLYTHPYLHKRLVDLHMSNEESSSAKGAPPKPRPPPLHTCAHAGSETSLPRGLVLTPTPCPTPAHAGLQDQPASGAGADTYPLPLHPHTQGSKTSLPAGLVPTPPNGHTPGSVQLMQYMSPASANSGMPQQPAKPGGAYGATPPAVSSMGGYGGGGGGGTPGQAAVGSPAATAGWPS
eukprot:357539-Chlamydomonas_euryale.AAC.1